jgi:hypothetical protein
MPPIYNFRLLTHGHVLFLVAMDSGSNIFRQSWDSTNRKFFARLASDSSISDFQNLLWTRPNKSLAPPVNREPVQHSQCRYFLQSPPLQAITEDQSDYMKQVVRNWTSDPFGKKRKLEEGAVADASTRLTPARSTVPRNMSLHNSRSKCSIQLTVAVGTRAYLSIHYTSENVSKTWHLSSSNSL